MVHQCNLYVGMFEIYREFISYYLTRRKAKAFKLCNVPHTFPYFSPLESEMYPTQLLIVEVESIP